MLGKVSFIITSIRFYVSFNFESFKCLVMNFVSDKTCFRANDPEEWLAAWRYAMQAISKYGGAEPGDRTMVCQV